MKTLLHDLVEKPPQLNSFIKFGLVGVLNTIIGYGAFFLLSYMLNYLLALVIAHFIGVTNSYFWNKYWTFRKLDITVKELVKFNLVYLVTLILNAFLLSFMVGILLINPRVGQLVALPIATIISYFGHKYWSFNAK